VVVLSHTAPVLLVIVMLLAGACSGRRDAGRSDTSATNAEVGPPSSGGMMSGHMPMMGGRAQADTSATPRTSATAAAGVGACPATGQALVDGGRLIFGGAGNCFACHGSSATGTPLAPDLTDAQWLNIDGSYASIIPLVRNGVPHPKQYPAPMPPMGGAQLSNEQVCAVAAYVYSLHRP
jgi:mono/diheme cytochrome c family protein